MPVVNSPLSLAAQGDQVKTVQTSLTKVGFTIPTTETSKSTFGAGTAAAVKQFQAQAHLPVTGVVDATAQAMLTNAGAVTAANQFGVSGVLVLDYGLPANGVTVRLYNIGFGGAATKLAEANRIPTESILWPMPRRRLWPEDSPAQISKCALWIRRERKSRFPGLSIIRRRL